MKFYRALSRNRRAIIDHKGNIMKERTLVLFTLLSQAAIGAFVIFYLIYPWMARIVGESVTHGMIQSILLAVGAFFGLGLLASLFHLGNPLNAWRALANLRSSWLSREILFALVFSCLWASVAILEWRQDGKSFIQDLLTWLAAISGLGLIYCMSRVYMLRTLQTWNSISTPLSFYINSFLSGAILVGGVLYFSFQGSPILQASNLNIDHDLGAGLLRWIGLGGFGLLIADLLISSLRKNRLRNDPLQSDKQKRFSLRLFTLRQSLLLLTLACASIFVLYPHWTLSISPTITIAAGLTLLIVLSTVEILERTLFYVTGLKRTL